MDYIDENTDNKYKKIKYMNSSTTRLVCSKEGLPPYIQYKIFDEYEEVISGFSTRCGGVSKGYLGEMNLSYSRGDDEENVTTNHKLFAKAVGYDYRRLVFSDQIHDIQIRIVTEEMAGQGIIKKQEENGIDGLITNERNLPLMTFYADCVPLFLYDTKKQVIGLAHSGWRGTVSDMGGAMVRRMSKEFDSRPKDIVCAIGPSICKDCYEVSLDVADSFKEKYKKSQCEKILREKENEKFQLDLHTACLYNFINAGVKKENIAMPDICTCCNSSLLFSHRASEGKRGNLAAVMMLK